jgi:hypothetical protein
VAPRGAALAGLLAESGAGLCVEPEDDAGLEAALETLLYPVGGESAPRTERFHWSNLAVQYQAVLETVDAGGIMPRVAARDTSSHTAPAGKSASAPWR